MSSDLWSAFTSDPEDPTSNPWAETPRDGTTNGDWLGNRSAISIGIASAVCEQEIQGDDFGDFEEAEPSDQHASQPLDPSGSPRQLGADVLSSSAAVSTQTNKDGRLKLALGEEPVPYTEDEWGEFSPEVTKSVPRVTPMPGALTTMQHLPSGVEPSPQKAGQGADRSKLAPANVPPPSILLGLAINLISNLPEIIKGSGDVSSDDAKRRFVAPLRALARILAGRKLRWKRDQFLSQSMSIGSAGKAGGMKLTGVDKTETQREDREAAELGRVWQQKVGPIRSALAGKPFPMISASPQIRTVKPVGLVRCCFLCGLKREERVDKIDVEVWDHFEEFWVEHWGHSDCRAFWEEYEQHLDRSL